MTTILIEQTRGYYILPLLFISLIFLLGCSKDDNNQAPNPNVDARLVGTWKGKLNRSSGQSDITLLLVIDGTLSLEAAHDSMSCPYMGTWTVIDERFKASCNNDCYSSTLTLFAPFAVDSLIGDWDGFNSVIGNYSGTFSVGKQ